jgi:hypothetical protein
VVRFLVGADNFFFATVSSQDVGPIQWVPGSPSSRVKWLGLEADHSSLSNAEVKECIEQYFLVVYFTTHSQ